MPEVGRRSDSSDGYQVVARQVAGHVSSRARNAHIHYNRNDRAIQTEENKKYEIRAIIEPLKIKIPTLNTLA